jgi:hypothetical protein
MRIKHLVTVAGLALARDSVHAQSWMLGAQAVPLATRADPTATRTVLTEGYLTQPVVMGHAEWSVLRGVATLNFEGLTLQRGELSTGGYGEGYVDRRHPHSYVHESLAGAQATRGALGASVFAGRGFAPFGSDDPMMRPFLKYPVNHHLAQVLERVVTVGAVRYGPVIAEGAWFNGDEPVSASEGPNWNRFGDSWSARLTLLPIAGGELSGSVAHVESPEVRLGRGLDARKESVVARFSRSSPSSWRYFLAEWAQTDERDRGASATVLSSWLAEGAYCRNDITAAARIEQTDRPEEESTLDPFRTPRPPADLSNLGVSRWTTVTINLSAPRLAWRFVSGRPFVEVARVMAAPGNPPGLFNTELRYGTSRMWMVSAGVRIRAGVFHDRMGRYGVALPAAGVIPVGTPAHDMRSHDMSSPTPTTSQVPHSMTNRCSL